MKKGLLVLLLVGAGLLIVFFFLKPAQTVTENILIEADKNAVHRCFSDTVLLHKWWNENSNLVAAAPRKDGRLADGNLLFSVTPRPFDIFDINIKDGNETIRSFVSIVPLLHDTTEVTWKAELPVGGLFGGLQAYSRAKAINQHLKAILKRLQNFIKSEQNIYGFTVRQQKVTDTLLVVTKSLDSVKPTVETYYKLLKKLHDYTLQQGAQETNYPMLNITQTDSAHFQTMVAIPINKPAPDAGEIVQKRMIPGAILVAEVKGGTTAVENGFRNLNNYANEHRLTQPGLSFQSLVTDRLAERDTSKWITRLYYPVN